MEGKREALKLTKQLIDNQFAFMFEEIDDFDNEDVINQVFVMVNMLFDMAGKFGYEQKIENIIKDHYGEKL